MTIEILPSSDLPEITGNQIQKCLDKYHPDKTKEYPLMVVGIRGFFYDDNKRGVYDDVIVLYVPNSDPAKTLCLPFNGNTDPSKIRKGQGTGSAKGMAVLDTGLWAVYRFDRHNGSSPHDAICERAGAVTVTVTRDGNPPYQEKGDFGINIHRGGFASTSSLGCQTIPPSQWNKFYDAAKKAAIELWKDAWKQKTVAYVLVTKADFDKAQL